MLPSLRYFGYPYHLKVFKLTTLHYKQVRGDMIGYTRQFQENDNVIAPTLIMSDTHKTRSNDLQLRSLV